ncbi:MAG: hypothetical protein K9L62_05970 [Vallitaleaceae bacterium]|nr:hypothetical protein [Vallitaleaceae bacterium]
MNTTDFSPMITAEPIGFIVYIQKDGVNLTFAEFCNASEMDVLDVMKILTSSSGFKAEPTDAIGFFLFEDNANRFVSALLSQ